MTENRQYDHEYKVHAVKLSKEIRQAKAAKELGIPKNTMYGWIRANRLGNLDLSAGSQTPQSAMTLNEGHIRLLKLRQQVKELEKENRRLKKENDFLEEASAFFAASRLKSTETKMKFSIKDERRRIKRESPLFLPDPSCQQTGILLISCKQRPTMEISVTGRCHEGDSHRR